MSQTLKELIESNARLADAVLSQTAAVNKIAPYFERLRQDVYTMLGSEEVFRSSLDLRLRDIDKNIALLVDNVKDTQKDIREVTNPKLLVPASDRESGPAKVIAQFEKMSIVSKIMILVIAIVLAASGWLTHLIK